jgi:imidazolonepropionase-like amidohydrolase
MRRVVLILILVSTVPLFADGHVWGFVFEEVEIDQLVQHWSRAVRPQTTAFVGVDLIAMTDNPATIRRDQTVVVRDGRIAAVGPRSSTPVPRDAKRVDGRGKFLMPGLTDAHVHTLETDADQLTHLFYGITTVREMDGFPWLLAKRDALRKNQLLGPTAYVAGTILNYYPMGWYARPIKTPAQARDAVHEQKAAGYDYIKIHNVMPVPIYDAVIETAKQEGLRVIGHIPHEISVKHAIESGQYTLEHFKGFYLDTTLEMSSEDWLSEIKGADVWITPTLTTRRSGMSDEETRAFMRSEEAQYVSKRVRERWPEGIKENGPSAVKVWALSQPIFRQLLSVTDRFLAGTDSGGGYPNSIPGFALLDELETFESLGMPATQVLRTATVNPSIALGDAQSFGTVETGKRADLLLLDRSPLETVRNLRNAAGVMVRGIWLDSKSLAKMRKQVREIYARMGRDASLDHPSTSQIDELVRRIDALKASGWVFRDPQMTALSGLLRAAGR